ncbi:MAG: hypothetical protein CM1200mP4_4410 [Rhodospirillaceae bacterium]|nr:MAG: hypothetical protein CM1200mP4_4410 [Rhodospirillaceae bacterium]
MSGSSLYRVVSASTPEKCDNPKSTVATKKNISDLSRSLGSGELS